MKRALVLLPVVLSGCLAPGDAQAIISDPGVQEAAVGVLANAVSGNVMGAATGAIDLAVLAWGIMKVRDMRRRKRGEQVDAAPTTV